MEQPADQYLSATEIAQWLGVSRRTVTRWMQAKIIQGSQINTRWRATRRAVQDFLDRQGGRPQQDEEPQ